MSAINDKGRSNRYLCLSFQNRNFKYAILINNISIYVLNPALLQRDKSNLRLMKMK